MLQKETEQKMKEREAALAEIVPPLNLCGLSLQELQVFHFIIVFHNYFYLSSRYILIPLEGVIYFFKGSLQRLAPQD